MKRNKEKRTSLLRQIVEIHHEQAKRRKALRILNKQEWSVEFMEYLVTHAAQVLHQDIIITITSPAGHKLDIKSVNASRPELNTSDDIFNHLDDEAAVQAFIRENSKR